MRVSDQIKTAIDECRRQLAAIAKRQKKPVRSVMLAQVGLVELRTGRLMPYLESKENEEEKHVCPLQLDVIERLLTLYSNPGDTVLTPFLGVGSEVFQSVMMGRRGLGIELKESYYRQAVKNIESAVSGQPVIIENDLFSDADHEELAEQPA